MVKGSTPPGDSEEASLKRELLYSLSTVLRLKWVMHLYWQTRQLTRGHNSEGSILRVMNSLWESEKQCWLLFITCPSPNLWSSCKDVESLAVRSTWSSPDSLFCCGWRFNLQVREWTLMIRTSQVTRIVLCDFMAVTFFFPSQKSELLLTS